MAVSNIKAIFENDIHKVWDIVFAVDKYSSWRSDLSKTEIINEKQFIEYTKDGYATTFSITAVEPYRRWEFDMEIAIWQDIGLVFLWQREIKHKLILRRM